MADANWRGSAIHGFTSSAALDYAISNAGAPFSEGPEACALLMNASRYISREIPVDSYQYKDFEIRIVTNKTLRKMTGRRRRRWQTILRQRQDHPVAEEAAADHPVAG